MLYKNWIIFWLNNHIKPRVKVRTVDRYEQLIRLHITPSLGEKDVKEITAPVIQSFIAELLRTGNTITNKGLSTSVVNTIISILQASIGEACSSGYASDFEAYKIRRPKVVGRKVDCFTVTEQKRIERFIFNSDKPKLIGIVLCLYTGLRIGELLALDWKSVDLTKGLLTVNRTCYDTKNGIAFDEPKTESSRRIIPIAKQLLPILKKIKKNSNSIFVISENDKAVSVRSYQRSFELLQKRLKIVHRGFHSLRHTFATRALECGMDVRTLSEILGHKNPTITLNRYAHSLLDHKVAMINRLGKLL